MEFTNGLYNIIMDYTNNKLITLVHYRPRDITKDRHWTIKKNISKKDIKKEEKNYQGTLGKIKLFYGRLSRDLISLLN